MFEVETGVELKPPKKTLDWYFSLKEFKDIDFKKLLKEIEGRHIIYQHPTRIKENECQTPLKYCALCLPNERIDYLCYFLESNPKKTLILCSTVETIESLARWLEIMGFPTIHLHTVMGKTHMVNNIRKFVLFRRSILIGTYSAVNKIKLPLIYNLIYFDHHKSYESSKIKKYDDMIIENSGTTLIFMTPQEYFSYESKIKQNLEFDKYFVPYYVNVKRFINVKKRVKATKEVDHMIFDITRECERCKDVTLMHRPAEDGDDGNKGKIRVLFLRRLADLKSKLTRDFFRHLKAIQ